MNNKVLVFGYGKMGRVHTKYLLKNKIDWSWYDPYVEADERCFNGDISKLDESGFTHVIIATPEKTHYKIYKEIKSGFSGKVLVEKPVIINKSNLDIFDNANISAGMVERFNPAIQALKSKINIDAVVSIDFTRCSAAPSVSQANIFEDIGIHDLDLYIYLLGHQDIGFVLDICSKTYCLLASGENHIARFIWSKETFFKERTVIVRQNDCTYYVDLQEQTLKKHYLDEMGRNIVEHIYVEKSSPVENELINFLEGNVPVDARKSHELMFKILESK